MIVRFLNLETSNHKVMTTLHFFKNSMVLAFLLFVSAFTFTACGDNAKKTDTEEVAEDQNKPNSDLTKESDERFLVRATEINMEEIELGKLAQQKGTHADVKALGKMMEDGHTKALNDLKTLAASKSIAVPAASTQDAINAYNKLNEKSGDPDNQVIYHKADYEITGRMKKGLAFSIQVITDGGARPLQ